ncbi:hypothetical protein ACU686_43985 [Yinghuangia aomiensis]
MSRTVPAWTRPSCARPRSPTVSPSPPNTACSSPPRSPGPRLAGLARRRSRRSPHAARPACRGRRLRRRERRFLACRLGRQARAAANTPSSRPAGTSPRPRVWCRSTATATCPASRTRGISRCSPCGAARSRCAARPWRTIWRGSSGRRPQASVDAAHVAFWSDLVDG